MCHFSAIPKKSMLIKIYIYIYICFGNSFPITYSDMMIVQYSKDSMTVKGNGKMEVSQWRPQAMHYLFGMVYSVLMSPEDKRDAGFSYNYM